MFLQHVLLIANLMRLFPNIREKGERREKGYFMEWTIIIASGSLHKIMWIRSAKDCTLTSNCKAIAICIYWYKRVTKSYIPAANAPARIEIPERKSENKDTHESKIRQKRGRPIGSKDKNTQKRKGVDNHIDSEENIPEKNRK